METVFIGIGEICLRVYKCLINNKMNVALVVPSVSDIKVVKHCEVIMLRSESYSLLRVSRNHTPMYCERDPSKHQIPGCGTSCQTTLNLQQVKT